MPVWKTKTGLPDALERRELLDGDRRATVDLDALGEAYQAAGWLSDALDCFERTGSPERLEALKRALIEADPFLLQRIDALAKVSPEEWRRAGELARAAGRHLHATRCFARAGDEAARDAAQAAVEAQRAGVERPKAGRSAALRSAPEAAT